MKTISIFAAILIGLFTYTPSIAQSDLQKETIKVWGNCGMCQKTIQKAAKSAGAKTAAWNEETKELKVTYAAAKTSGKKIQEAIAKAGYDTQDFTADDNAYSNLHACCQYDRKGDEPKGEVKKCCDNVQCGKEADACKDKACCKEKTCCKS